MNEAVHGKISHGVAVTAPSVADRNGSDTEARKFSHGLLLLGGIGYGKSTLAACFLGHGYRFVSDGPVAIDIGPDAPQVLPGNPVIELSAEAAQRFLPDNPKSGGISGDEGKDHFLVHVLDQFHGDSTSIAAIYILEHPRFASRQLTIDKLTPGDAFQVMAEVAIDRVRAEDLKLVERLAQLVPCYLVSYPTDFQQCEMVVKQVIAASDAAPVTDFDRKSRRETSWDRS